MRCRSHSRAARRARTPEGAPGYDLDEQAAYEEGAGAGGGEEEPSSRDAAADEESPNPPD